MVALCILFASSLLGSVCVCGGVGGGGWMNKSLFFATRVPSIPVSSRLTLPLPPASLPPHSIPLRAQNWAGSFNSCTDPEVTAKALCVGSFNPPSDLCRLMPNSTLIATCTAGQPVTMPRKWGPWLFGIANFNDIFSATLMVMEVAIGEMWPGGFKPLLCSR